MSSSVFLPILLLLHSTITVSTKNDITRFRMEGFANENLTLTNSSVILSSGLLYLAGNDSNQLGHAFFPNPLNLKSSTSFSTTFVFGMVYRNKKGDHGMAFALSPSLNLPYSMSNRYLGLFSNKPTRDKHIFAVELDTVQDPDVQDMNKNHIGIDVETVISTTATSASYIDKNGKNQTLDLHSGNPMQVWIEYNTSHSMVEVRLAPLGLQKPKIALVSAKVHLSSVLTDETYVGFTASTGGAYGQHYVLGWSFSMDGEPLEELDPDKLPRLPSEPHRLGSTVIFGLVIVGLVVISACIGGIVYWRLRKRKFEELIDDGELSYGPNRISYKELYRATKGFKEENLLGQGGFGRVYKGTMPKTRAQVAVKKISHDSSQGVREFVAEITSMARLRHRNLVQLLGYCRRKGELLLVYDYMENGSLDKFLYSSSKRETLSWEQRFKVAKGVAEGLHYLHEGWEQVVVHRDIKASNVLLDSNFNGRLGDFGLSKILDRGDVQQQTTRVVGTFGYMAPEITRVGKATTFTDVYAFGSFLLEVVCGRPPIMTTGTVDSVDRTPDFLVDRVLELWRSKNILDAVDPRLGHDYSIAEAETLLKLGVLCSQEVPALRLTMRQVVQAVEGDLQVPVDPPEEQITGTTVAAVLTTSEGVTPTMTTISSFWSSEQPVGNECSSFNLDTISSLDTQDHDLYPNSMN